MGCHQVSSYASSYQHLCPKNPAPFIHLLFLSFFNNIIGITDPNQLNPPSFCSDEDTEVDTEEEPRDFLSLFL